MAMTAGDVIADLAARGMRLVASPDGDRLGVEPAGQLTPEDSQRLRRYKAAILQVLRSESVVGRFTPWPIIPGREHFPLFIRGDERYWREFVPGHHVDVRQPTELRGLLWSPPEAAGDG